MSEEMDVENVAVACLKAVLGNESWQNFGFKKRPQYGAVFQKFRKPWKVDLEKKLIQEILITSTAAYVVSGKISDNKISDIVSFYTYRSDVVTALGFPSQEIAEEQLMKFIKKYCSKNLDDWPKLILERIDASSVPDKKWGARLMVGSVKYVENIRFIIFSLRQST